MSEKPVVLILAAGLGTRMNSSRVKVLHEVAGRPLIAWVVDACRDAGAEGVVAILGHQRDAVKALLDQRYGDDTIGVAIQEEQNGTGHAVQCALPNLADEPDERVIVILTGDAPRIRSERIAELASACAASRSGMALLSTHPTRPVHYGRLVRDDDGTLLRIVEHRDATDHERTIEEMNAGFYAVRMGVLRAGLAALSSDNAQGELYLTDLAEAASKQGGAAVIDAPFDEIYGINDRLDLAEVDGHARLAINEALMRGGVTMPAPDQVFVDADVGAIGRDVWLGAGVCLRGNTTIGDDVRIDVGCVLDNVSVQAGAWIKPYSVLGDSKIGPKTQIGPFTHCRPGTQVDEGAKLGNFVETKKTHLMAGAKANHLTYLGDASIGAKANVGAGTITCNYDGFKKYKTDIGAGAFIGSDVQLIAPVSVGRGAFVGAGTTVTKDVPRGALALTRVKQVNVEGWADRFRAAQEKRENR